jgi:peptide/nickel transport system permease protein
MNARVALALGLGLLGFVAVGPLGLEALGLDATAIAPDHAREAPSLAHPLGTDELGRDVLARLAVGGRVSLTVAFGAALVAAAFGGALGLLAGYLGGAFDRAALLALDAFAAVPKLPLLLVLSGLQPFAGVPWPAAWSGAPREVVELSLLLAALAWTGPARLARQVARRLAESEVVLAARALGASELFTLRVHVLPAALGPLSVAFAEDVGELIVYESALSFLGLGVQPPTPSWGAMLMRSLTELSRAPASVILPGLGTLAAVLLAQRAGTELRRRLRLQGSA